MESPLLDEELGGPPGSQTEYCSWEVQDAMLALRLWIVDWLSYQLAEGLKSPDKPGEVGGILLGRTKSVGRKKIILVERFVPVPCESGALWHLSKKDKGLLTEQLERWRPGDGKKKFQPIGFYRSHNREGLGFDGEDLALARDFFAGPDNVFLLVKPLAPETMVGGFIFWKNRELAVKPDLTFPFSREHLLAGETTFPVSPRDETPAQQEAAPATASVPAREVKPARQVRAVSENLSPGPAAGLGKAGEPTIPGASRAGQIPPSGSDAPALRLQLVETSAFSERLKNVVGRVLKPAWLEEIRILPQARALFWGVVLALAVGAGYLLVARRFAAPAAETISKLDLQVENEKNLFFLSWNKNVPPIAAGNSGVLSIIDGTYQQNVSLDAAQLHGGVFEYAPRTEDVTFRLAVKAPMGQIGEWVRVVVKDHLDSPAGRTVIKPHSRGWTGLGNSANPESLFGVLPAQGGSAPVGQRK